MVEVAKLMHCAIESGAASLKGGEDPRGDGRLLLGGLGSKSKEMGELTT